MTAPGFSQDAADRLASIADAIGVPVSSLLTDPVALDDLTGTAEMLRLWLALKSMDDRLALLIAARAAVDAQVG